MSAIDPLTAAGVVLATAATDAVYVMFTSAVVARRRVPAATWSSVWYVLSSFAVISYTENWVYVVFAAVGPCLGGFGTSPSRTRPPVFGRRPLRPTLPHNLIASFRLRRSKLQHRVVPRILRPVKIDPQFAPAASTAGSTNCVLCN